MYNKMSYVPGNKSEDPKVHFEAGVKDFARLDKVRLINIGGSIQYGILYCLVFFFIGIILHNIFPTLNKSDRHIGQQFFFETFIISWIQLL